MEINNNIKIIINEIEIPLEQIEDTDVEIKCGQEQKTLLDLDEVKLIYKDKNKNTYSGYKNGKWICEFSVVPDSEDDLICKKNIRG